MLGERFIGITKRKFSNLMAEAIEVGNNARWQEALTHPLVLDGELITRLVRIRNTDGVASKWPEPKWDKIPKASKDFRIALEYLPESAREYAASDAGITSLLARELMAQLEREPRLRDYYTQIEKPLTPLLYEMEQAGCRINPEALTPVLLEVTRQENQARQMIQALCGRDVNPYAPRQVQDMLLEKKLLGAKSKKSMDTGAFTVDEKTLLGLAKADSSDKLDARLGVKGYNATWLELFVKNVLDARGARKMRTTYVERLRNSLDGESRIHSTFNQTATATNRLSSSDPNLQNIPHRSEIGKQIRRAFVASPGNVLARFDWSQVELRIAAHYTQETVLLEAYRKGLDVHDMMRETLGLPNTSDGRGIAKNSNFAMIYGVEEKTYAATVGLPIEQARDIMSTYKKKMPRLFQWAKQVESMLVENGYTETLLGWRGYYPEYWSPLLYKAAEAFRSAVNAPIQGTAAGLYKQWWIEFDRMFPGFDIIPVLSVHDELVLDMPKEYVKEAARVALDIAKQVGLDAGLTVPLDLGMEVGPNWTDMESFTVA